MRARGPVLSIALAVFACASATTTTTTTTPTEGGTPHMHDDPERATASTSSTTTTVWPTIETRAPSLSRAAVEPKRPKGDQSRTFAAWETSWVRLEPPPGEEGELNGEVIVIVPAPADASGRAKGSLRIEAADGRVVELPLSGPGTLALAPGDEVKVRWRVRHHGIHLVRELGVLDRNHRVIYASSGSGDASFAPGWYVEAKDVAERSEPRMKGGAARESRWLVLAKGDASALVKESEGARRLVTPEGDYAVSGSAISWSDGMLPPDASSYESFGLVLLPAAP